MLLSIMNKIFLADLSTSITFVIIYKSSDNNKLKTKAS